MRVYKVHCHHPDLGRRVSWASSEQEAKRLLREVLKEYENPKDAEPKGIEKVEIPTDKVGLIAWLNLNLNTDNG